MIQQVIGSEIGPNCSGYLTQSYKRKFAGLIPEREGEVVEWGDLRLPDGPGIQPQAFLRQRCQGRQFSTDAC